jgi:flotillin
MEKLQFALPAVFTIGPDNEMTALKKYALLLSGENRNVEQSRTRNHVLDIVKGIIEGETRVIVSGMTMEEIFKERQIFKSKGRVSMCLASCVLINNERSEYAQC